MNRLIGPSVGGKIARRGAGSLRRPWASSIHHRLPPPLLDVQKKAVNPTEMLMTLSPLREGVLMRKKISENRFRCGFFHA
jgi:hypothetical protein